MSLSKNKLAYEIIQSKFFEDINCIDDLIKKINNGYNFNKRGIRKTQGDIFEIFCEALLATNLEYKVKNVYPQGYVPINIRKKLKLSYQDKGYDGVYESDEGQFSTYQAKYRFHNEQLTWQGENGLSSFIGVSEKAHTRHLIATTNKVSSEFLLKSRIRLTLLSDLKKLNKNDFEKIKSFLENKKIKIKRHKPEKYQQIAVRNIINELKTNDRTTIIMACGTGKTEVGLWVYEKIKPKTCLVLVPSIALVKQIRAAWLSQMSFSVRTFQLCSSRDITKQEDYIQVKKNDLDMEFYSDVENLKKWINKNKNQVKIIFSTYQSSKLLKNVFNKKNQIDFAVFDEAHRTAVLNSKIDSYFSFSLHDKNIPIKKRLFMTATRRVSSLSKFKKTGESYLNVDMDNKQLYGNICYSLSFYQAAKKYKAIAKPRIIISEVYSDEVSAEHRKLSATHFKGVKFKSDYLALIIAIKKAIYKYKIKKVFSFHRTVKDAKTFADPKKPESIKPHLKDFFTNYVSGSMNMRKRSEIMDEFVSENKGFISNARCLVEGVNVPAVDMVSFTHQKESEIDIVQAIGRALRNRNQSKKFGYVLVPIFVERNKNEKIEDALERTNFKKVIVLLKALREHDTEIAQIIDEIVINESRGKGFALRNRKKISDLIETVNPEIKRKILIKAIHTKVIENLRLKWDLMIGQLLDFKKKFHHLNVGYNDPSFRDLRKWVTAVRKSYRDNKLYNFQVEQLLKIGFKLEEPNINVFNQKNYYTFSQLGKKFLNKKYISKLIEKGVIKSVGIAWVPGEGPSKVYKRYNEKEFLRLIKADFLPNKNLVSTSQLAKNLDIDRSKITGLVKRKLLKPEGKTVIAGGNKIANVFKNISKKEFNKKLGITINDTDKFTTLSGLAVHIFGKKSKSSTISLAIKEKKIKPVGYGFYSGKRQSFYKKISKDELKKRLNINFFEKNKNHLSFKEVLRQYKIGRSTLKYLIKKKRIKPLGIAIGSSSVNSRVIVFKRYTSEEFCKITGIDFINNKNFITLKALSNKTKIGRSTLLKLIKNKLLEPAGRTYKSRVKPVVVFRLISRLKILNLIKKNKIIFSNYKKIKL
jgi:superfamily II DNA or RNA helicase/RNase P/RNase MRP subunit POP5